jgi:hypothetical protein
MTTVLIKQHCREMAIAMQQRIDWRTTPEGSEFGNR